MSEFNINKIKNCIRVFLESLELNEKILTATEFECFVCGIVVELWNEKCDDENKKNIIKVLTGGEFDDVWMN